MIMAIIFYSWFQTAKEKGFGKKQENQRKRGRGNNMRGMRGNMRNMRGGGRGGWVQKPPKVLAQANFHLAKAQANLTELVHISINFYSYRHMYTVLFKIGIPFLRRCHY